VAGTVAVGDFVPKWYGTPVDMITYGGVDVENYSQMPMQDTKLPLRIAYLGRFEVDTGVFELVRAVQAYLATHKATVELHLFGHGSLMKQLSNLQQSELPIFISPPVVDITGILKTFPIIFASGYLTILEALCARRIVFAYYNNPLREDYLRLHPAADSLFVCGSVEDVVTGLSKCIQDTNNAFVRSEHGWDWAQKQSWENLAQKYVSLWGL